MKVLFMTNVPSPYRVDFFNELGKYVDLTVLFEKHTSSIRDDSWKEFQFKNFKGVLLKGVNLTGSEAFCPSVIRYLKRGQYDIIICGVVASPTVMLAMQYMQFKKIPYWLEIDGGFAKDGKGFKEAIKRHFISKAQYYMSPAKEADKYLAMYGAKLDEIIRYPFTSVKQEELLSGVLNKEEKEKYKAELDINENRVILCIGQFVKRKGFDILLRAMSELPQDIGVYFVGGKETDEYINMVKELKLTNVHFVGFKKKGELKNYYLASDVFVLPTREDIWGLVVNEAMAYGLPVITTERCISGLELVNNGKNGYIVPVEDSNELAKTIEKLFNQLDDKMGSHALETIKNYTIEQMVKVHLDAFEAKVRE